MHKVFKLNLTVSDKYYKIISIARQYYGIKLTEGVYKIHGVHPLWKNIFVRHGLHPLWRDIFL
jgi:hypothetical protein